MRSTIAGLLGLVLGFPVAALFWDTLSWQSLQMAWREPVPIAPLVGNTFALILITIFLAVPPGVIFGYVSLDSGVASRRGLGAGVLACLFIPLPVWAVSWQIIFGEWLPPLALEPGDIAWRPWKQGLLPAAWIHAVAALPWVVAIVRLILGTAHPALEEEARQTAGPRGVFRWVILPRLIWAIGLASAVVALQVGTEIAVTDAMMVRTFAEEVYTQMVVRSAGLSGAIAVTVPVWLVTAAGLALIARAGLRRFRTAEESFQFAPPGRPKISPVASLFAWGTFAVYLGLPVGALVWKAAGGGVLPDPSVAEFAQRLGKVIRTEWITLLDSLAAAAAAGAVTALLAWFACALGAGSPRYRGALWALCLALIALPGPLVGFGLKRATVELVSAERALLGRFDLQPEFPPLRSMLYDQPSPIPGIWVCALRFFPLACGIIALAMLRIPKSLVETAVAEGRNPRSPWAWVIAPFTSRAFVFAAVAVAALALGEVSAGKLAQPPARGVFILRLFDQMHYGAESTVAGLCLLQLATTWGILGLLVGLRPERTP